MLIILASINECTPKGFAPMVIGLGLLLIHLRSNPIANTSVNYSISTRQVLFAEGSYVFQLWLFWVAPIAGAIVVAFIDKAFFDKK